MRLSQNHSPLFVTSMEWPAHGDTGSERVYEGAVRVLRDSAAVEVTWSPVMHLLNRSASSEQKRIF